MSFNAALHPVRFLYHALPLTKSDWAISGVVSVIDALIGQKKGTFSELFPNWYKVHDLMGLLKESLEQHKKRRRKAA